MFAVLFGDEGFADENDEPFVRAAFPDYDGALEFAQQLCDTNKRATVIVEVNGKGVSITDLLFPEHPADYLNGGNCNDRV